jgi:N12 class adenine-specific DNA methylase
MVVIRKLHDITEKLKRFNFQNAGKPTTTNHIPPIRYKPTELREQDRNNVIEANDVLIETGTIGKLNANMEAILLLRLLLNENRNPTTAEKKVLQKFVGWGGIAEVFKPKLDWKQEFVEKLLIGAEAELYGKKIPQYSWVGKTFQMLVQDVIVIGKTTFNQDIDLPTARHAVVRYFLSTFDKLAYQNAINSTINAHYTSRTVIQEMWKLLEKAGFQGGNILENSAGIGHFFGLIPQDIAQRSVLYAVEKDRVTGLLLQHLYPQVDVQITGFEDADLPLGAFDLVIGNVPFGQRGLVQDLTFKEISAFNLHNYFIAKSLIALRAGGLCFVISSHSTMDNGEMRENDEVGYVNSFDFRKWADSADKGNADLLGAIRLPNNAFVDNANTEVVTDIILLRKRDSPTSHNHAQAWLALEKVGEGKYLPTAEDKEKIAKKKIKEQDLPNTVDIKVNEYYAQNPFMMIGKAKLQHQSNSGRMYNDANRQTVELDNPQEFPTRLKEAFTELGNYVKGVYAHNPNLATLTNTGIAIGQIGEFVTLPDNKAYKIVQANSSSPKTYQELVHFKSKDIEMLRGYGKIKTVLKRLLILEQGETEESAETAIKRKELNQAYDEFIKEFGYINKHKRLMREESDWYLLSNLEIFKPKNNSYEKAPIFNKKVAYGFPNPEKAENIEDAYEISINYRGAVDVSYIARLLAISEVEATQKLLTTEVEAYLKNRKVVRPLAFLNPATGLIEEADKYLSGNIRKKLAEAKEFAEKDAQFHVHVKHLEAHQAEWLPLDKISYGIQSSWIPVEVIESFAREVLKIPIKITRHMGYARLHVSLSLEGRAKKDDSGENKKHGWIVENRTSEYDIFRNGVADKVNVSQNDVRYYATDLIEALMSNSRPTIKRKKVDENGRVIVKKDKFDNEYNVMEVDEYQTSELQRKMFELNVLFRQFVGQDKTRIGFLELIYNNTFNESIEREWTVPKIKVFPGANPDIVLRDHQKQGVKRALQESMGGFYGVGTGKTYTIITIAMEMRRLGIAKKPLIVVQNATLEQFIAQARKLYPTAKILAPTITESQSVKVTETNADKVRKAQLAREERVALFAQMRLGDWDMIILPQSQFDLIPDSPERMKSLLYEKLAEMEEQLDWVDEDDKGLQSRLKAKIKDIQSQIDEQEARLEEDKYLEKVEDSKQKTKTVKDSARAALRIETKLKRQLDRKTDKTLYFEQLGIDALLIDEAHAYKRLGFETNLTDVKGIDTAFSKRSMSAYLKITYIYETLKAERNVSLWTGTPISNTMAEMWTMARFLRPSLLQEKRIQSFDSFAGVFAMVENTFEMDAGGRYKTVARLTRFDNMPELLKIWKSFADVVIGQEVLGKSKDTTDKDYIEAHKNNYHNQTPLLALQSNGERGYTNIIINKSPAQRKQVSAFQQLLNWFDKVTGVCKKNNAHIPLVVFGRAKQATIDLRLLPDYINLKDTDCLPRAPTVGMQNEFDADNKLFACADNVLKIYKRDKANPTAQLVFCDTFRRVLPDYDNLNSKGEPKEIEVFNVYTELKRILVEGGIPAHEIAIITDHENNRLPLYTKVKNAEIRVLIGSTQKMGVGVDVQDRLVALHHIDAPTRPMDFEQRNGRIIRQGNMNAIVEIFTYGIEGTLDAVAYNRLKQKQEFINQLMKGDSKERSMQDGLDDEGDADFFAQLSSMLTGSTTAVDLLKAKKELALVKAKIEFEQQEASKRVVEHSRSEERLALYKARLKELKTFAQAIQMQFEKIEDFTIQKIVYANNLTWDNNTTKKISVEKQDKEGKVIKTEKDEKVKLSEALAEVLAYYEPLMIAHFRQGVQQATREHDYKGALNALLAGGKQENIYINDFLFLLHFKLRATTGVSMSNYPYSFRERFGGNNTEFEIDLLWNVIHENELVFKNSDKVGYTIDLREKNASSDWQGDLHKRFRGIEKEVADAQRGVEKEQSNLQYLAEQIANPTDLKALMESVPVLSNKVVALERKLKLEQEADMREAMHEAGLRGFTNNAYFVHLGSLEMTIVERKENAQDLKPLIKKLRALDFSKKGKKTLSGTNTLFPTHKGTLTIIE